MSLNAWRAASWSLLLVALLLLIKLLYWDQTLKQYQQLQEQVEQLQEKKLALETAIVSLRQAIEKNNDTAGIEARARAQYDFVKPTEVLYRYAND